MYILVCVLTCLPAVICANAAAFLLLAAVSAYHLPPVSSYLFDFKV